MSTNDQIIQSNVVPPICDILCLINASFLPSRVSTLQNVSKVFYHLPALRRMILSSDMRGVEISKEFDALRKTFTLLKGSQKSWIEAGDYVKVFKAHMPSGNTQQDVSEFVHKMLDVCENALKRDENNPVKQLFYGEILQTGLDQDKKVFTFTQRVVQKPHHSAQQVAPR